MGDRSTVLPDESADRIALANSAERIEQLEAFGEVLSHDLGNVLTIARSRLELARESPDDEHLEEVDDSLRRAIEMLENLARAIEAGTVVDEMVAVDVGSVFEAAWESQETRLGSCEVTRGIRIRADETALQRMLENLIRNAFEHGDETSTVRLGPLPDGFYVEDDGVGIPEADRTRVFDPGYTTKADGTGIGLVSIQQIALAHGWRPAVAAGSDGGARFEFTNVEMADAGGSELDHA